MAIKDIDLLRLKYHREGYDIPPQILDEMADDLASGRKRLGERKDHSGNWNGSFFDIPTKEEMIQYALDGEERAKKAGNENLRKRYTAMRLEYQNL